MKGSPEIVVGQWCFDDNFFFADRMDEMHGVAEEGDAAVGVAALGAILEVTLDGAADFGELATDLVVAPCLEIHLDEIVVVGMADDFVVEDGFLAVGHLMIVGIRLVLLLIAHEPMGQRTFRLRRHVLDNRPILLLHFTVCKHGIES